MKKIIITFALALIIVPSVASAAWYNPFSWGIWNIFKKSSPTPVVQIETNVQATNTTSVATSTTISTEKKIAPQTKTAPAKVVQPVQVQSQVASQAVTQADRDRMEKDLVTKFHAINAEIKSKDAAIKALEEDAVSFSKNKNGDFDVAVMVMRDTAQFTREEKALDQFFLDQIGKITTDEIELYYDKVVSAYDQWVLMVKAFDTDFATRNDFIKKFINEGTEIAKLRIQLEVIAEMAAENGVSTNSNTSLAQIQLERDRIRKEADDFIKNLAETQVKLQGKDGLTKQKREDKFKAVLYLISTPSTSLPR